MTEASAEPWTIQRLLVWTAGHFGKHGREMPRLAAEVLLSEALGCKRIDLYARFNDVPVEPQLVRYRDWVRRHAAGEPVAYLVGYRDFYSLRFAVNNHVLIPRPETEQLVLEAIGFCEKRLASHPDDKVRVLEIGTGSGCIAVTLAQQVKEIEIVAVDVSPEALVVARQNAETHQVADRIEFLESDLDARIEANRQFDLIVSNPPYVGRNESGTLDESVRKHEPALALYGGDVGTEITGRIIELSSRRLAPGGVLIFETSPLVAAGCASLVRESGHFGEPGILKDLAKLDRIIRAGKSG